MTASKTAGERHGGNERIHRRPFVAELMRLRGTTLVVPGLGSPTWDLFASGDSGDYLYSWGGMGLAVSTALGIALAQPGRRVLALTGDGELMMGIGTLAVVGDQAPANLAILVLDNEAFSETGRQRGLSGRTTNLCAVAQGFGIARTMDVTSAAETPDLARLLFETPGPVFAVAKIAITEDPWRLPEKDGGAISQRFRRGLGLGST